MKPCSRRTFLCRVASGAGAFALGSPPIVWGAEKKKLKRDRRELVHALSGLHNFLTTPFHDNFDLDADGLCRNVEDHARSPTKSMTIVVSGGLGELYALTVEEHKRLVRAAVEGAQGKFPVIAGVGGAYPNAIQMARNAEAAGADAIYAFLSPFGCGFEEGAYRFVHDIAAAVSIGVLAYPCGKHAEFWPRVLKRMAALPNVIGIKDGSEEPERAKPLAGKDFVWVSEGEGHAEKFFPHGARALTTAVAVFIPEICRDFVDLGLAGKYEEMKKLRETRIDPVVKLRNVKEGYGIGAIKIALEALGRAGGPVRPPLLQISEEDRVEIGRIAKKYATIHGRPKENRRPIK